MNMFLQRPESTINRNVEIRVADSWRQNACQRAAEPEDSWRWQRSIRGTEYSVWSMYVEGRITLQECHRSGRRPGSFRRYSMAG